MNNDLLAERYHNELEQKYYGDLEKIDRETYDELVDDYKKLEQKYESLKAGHEYFLDDIKKYLKNDNIGGLVEYLKSEGLNL